MPSAKTLSFGLISLFTMITVWRFYKFSSEFGLFTVLIRRPTRPSEDRDGDIAIEEWVEKANLESMIYSKSKDCEPQQNVLFLKTHKTGSSTVTNILNRYADVHELTVALPKKGESWFGWPSLSVKKNVDPDSLNDDKKANILSNHARFNFEELEEIMEDGAIYISILRHPASQFESTFYYLEMYRIFRLRFYQNPLAAFMLSPDKHVSSLQDKSNIEGLFQNGMLYDLGYDKNELNDIGIDGAIQYLEEKFDFFLILEYFDESLILLKRRMCWSFEDIVYFRLNERNWKSDTWKSEPIKGGIKQAILEWNHQDWLLYQHYNRTLWKYIDNEDNSFWDELLEFQIFKTKWQRNCKHHITVSRGSQKSAVKLFRLDKTVEDVHKETCERFFRKELDYLQYFRKKVDAEKLKRNPHIGYKLV